jgi:multicomponent Na+:H+ antiporter subunit B
MTLIVKTITRLTIGIIFIYGIYITLQGHLGPGGGFAGGVIVALSFIHILLAFGKDVGMKKLTQKKVLFLMSAGAVVFLAAAVFNFTMRHNLEIYALHAEKFRVFSPFFMPLYDIAVCFMVGTGLYAIFLALALFTPESNKER